MAKRVLAIVLLTLPVLTAGLWLISGGELLTKSAKAVSVPVRDELFGETFVQEQLVPGPVLGYYVGLDAVVVVTVLCAAAGLAWGIARRRASSQRNVS